MLHVNPLLCEWDHPMFDWKHIGGEAFHNVCREVFWCEASRVILLIDGICYSETQTTVIPKLTSSHMERCQFMCQFTFLFWCNNKVKKKKKKKKEKFLTKTTEMVSSGRFFFSVKKFVDKKQAMLLNVYVTSTRASLGY